MGNTKQTKQFYLNNPNIPAKNAELEFTEEQWIEYAKEIKKCKKDIFYFAKKYIYILNPDRGRELVKLYDYQKRMLKKIVENRFSIFNTSRQIGKSMLISIYATWYLCFNEDKSILLSADKEATAIEIFGKVKLAYEMLPNWLKPGAIEFSKTKMNFDNGCRMQVTTTTEQTGRGFSINVLLLDEFAFVPCICKNEQIELNHNFLRERKCLSIGDAYKMFKDASTSNWLITTPFGKKPFLGISKVKRSDIIKLYFDNGKVFKCASNHRLQNNDNEFIEAKDLLNVNVKYNNTTTKCIKIKYLKTPEYVYDIIESETHTYISSGFISHNCEVARAFFSAVLPTISASKTSKVIITSTPNGVGNLFYELFTGAKEGKNKYAWDTVIWSDVPGRTEEFKQEQLTQIGYKMFAQEYEAQFISDANSFLPEEMFQQYRIDSKPPLLIMDNNRYKIWKEYNKEHIYVIGVDVGEGVGRDRSNMSIFDITNLEAIEQVATFSSDDIGPYQFISKCYEVACMWGQPYMVIERNNQGGQIVDGLHYKYHYPNLISYGASVLNKKSNIIGILSHTNIKLQAITNFRYWLLDRKCIKLNDIDSITQFKEFVQYPNGTWAAIKGDNHHDDYIMSMIWALFILHDGIVEKIFNIIETDANKRPLLISLEKNSIFDNIELGYNEDAAISVMFGGYTNNNSDATNELQYLLEKGYTSYTPGNTF